MAILEALSSRDLIAACLAYRDALRAHQGALNRLNVYPVPDGDTGTNMALTVESVVAELPEKEPEMASVCRAISHGSLMGARGNSGVILSQVLRGLVDQFRGAELVRPADLAAALEAASTAAYGAVMRPVEGTILTVVRETANAASRAAASGAALVDVLEAAKRAGSDTLARTPELLPVLAQAGVVDAGGAGFVLFVDALLHVATGRPLPEAPAPPSDIDVPVPVVAGDGVEGGPRYEVMFLLEADDAGILGLREAWAGLGDSVVVVGGEGLWNCHIHTDDIGASIEAGIAVGRPSRIRVTDLLEQVEEEAWVRSAGAGAADGTARVTLGSESEPATCGVVAVAVGAGVVGILASLGVHRVVSGGQTMNPSTAQLLEAVEGVPAAHVVVLPNNKNIIPVAEQVARLTDKQVEVVRTTSVVEAFAALLEFDPESDAAENAKAMAAAAGRVSTGEVTRAVRDAPSPAGPISVGDHLGVTGDGVIAVAASASQAAIALLARLVEPEHEVLTLVVGVGASEADTEAIRSWLAENHAELEVEIHDGGQPLYPYLVGVE